MNEARSGNRWRVACVGPWAPPAQELMRQVAPDEFEVVFSPVDDETRQPLIDTSDFVFAHAPITARMIGRAERLRLIQKWGIGVDKIDLAAAEAAGIAVTITAGANASAVAEHTIMLMLATLRRLAKADRSLREGRWIHAELRIECFQLRGRTVGIVGFGNIGRMVARKLRGFEVRTIYYDPIRPTAQLERELEVEFVPFHDLLAQSDIVTLHFPGTPANRNFLDAAALARMKPDAFLINCARGEVVEEAALLEALRSGRLRGAGLDVFAHEPLARNSAFLELESVVMTPHTAGSVLDNVQNVARHGFANMQRMARGEPLPEADIVVPPPAARAPKAAAAS